LLLGILLSPALNAQFGLFLVEGNSERVAPSITDLGSVYAGESATAHFRLRNTSSVAATLSSVAVAGVGFTLISPSLPLDVAPKDAVDLTVTFRAADMGAYSASFNSTGIAVLLIATVAPRLTYRVDPSGAAPFPGTLDFGGVLSGSGAERRIVILNETPLVLTIPAISVEGGDFILRGTAFSGQALEPRQSREFSILFTPQTTGLRQGLLRLGDRSYPLLGTGIAPPLPKPTVSVDLKQAASATQGTLIIRFDAPAQTSGTGTAILDFPGPSDPAISFAAGGRSVAFPIAQGDTQAVLPFQTGTTAGVLSFTAQVGGWIDQQSVTIGAVPPGVSTIQAMRTAAGLEIRITGFDNTRSIGSLAFTFYDATGNPIAPGAIRADATKDFASYFASSGLGGIFQLRAVFPVDGNAAGVASCEATLSNSAGTVTTQRTFF